MSLRVSAIEDDISNEDYNHNIRYIKRAIKSICDKNGTDKMWLFGSYSRGDHTEDSDIDFLIEGSVWDDGKYELVTQLERDLKQVFKKDVDVVCYNDIEEGVLKEWMNLDKRLVYEANK